MKKLLCFALVLLATGGSLFAQIGNISNPLAGNLNVQDAGTCTTTGSIIQQLPPNASTTTLTLAGTFSATITVRTSNNGTNWTTANTLSAAGTTSYSTNGLSHLCVDVTAYTSGVVQVTILTGLLQVQSVVSGSGSGSPSSLSTFFSKYYGLAPDDCGNAACTNPATIRYAKFCYDGVVTGQPTTTFKSLATGTITNTALTNNVATYTLSGAQPLASGELVTVTGTSNGGGVYNVTNQPILNYALGATTFTVAITNANVGSAADSGTATASCANFSSLDQTSVIEILQGGLNTALDVSTTISGVTSASQITLGANATTNATGKKFWFGTDATTPVRNWAAAINAGVPSATGLLTHSGYVPGMYLITKGARLINPLGAFDSNNVCTGTTGEGFGTPEPWSAQNANESLSIWGQGSYRSGFVALSTFNWAADGTGVDTGVFHFNCWNGPTIQNIAVLSPDPAIAFNTSTLTGKFGAFFDDANGHVTVTGVQIANFHNTTSSLVADQMVNGTYGNTRSNIQIYRNDCGGSYGGGLSSLWMYDISWDHIDWGGTKGSACSPAAAVSFGREFNGGYARISIANSKIDSEGGSSDMPAGNGLLNFAASISMSNNEEINLSNFTMQTAQPNNFALSVNTTAAVKLGLSNVNISNTGTATASTQLILNQNGASDINLFGGTLSCSGTCANGISNASGSAIHGHGTRQLGTISIVGTGASTVSMMTPQTTGWSGPGVLRNTLDISDQGTVCTNGELVLSAGWQSTGSATVTAVGGTGQTCQWTITTGTTTAANPTVTDTLTNALPTATTVCELNIHGGTHTAVAGENFQQTTLSATAPIFTANFTPTAGGTTYFVTRRCGP